MASQPSPPPSKRQKLMPPNAYKYYSWSCKEVLEFFRLRGIDNDTTKAAFKQYWEIEPEAIKGDVLDKLALSDDSSTNLLLGEEGSERVPKELYSKASSILALMKSLQQQQYTIFNDPIHGTIELHPLIVRIIDTPEFQRLRNIKQLGGGCYVFAGATHTRFEHSIGVCYIAGEVARNLQRKQEYLNITDKDILCIQIAGLCHDLGHGPFSHMFESYFMHEHELGSQWKHAGISVKVFDHLYRSNKLEKCFKRFGLSEEDLTFIREQIEGVNPKDKDKAKGRPQHKHFLYEIVANKRNGIDVDKWDYFARDCHYLGITNDFQWRRSMLLARAIEVRRNEARSGWQICMRDKEVDNVYNMFHTRNNLRRRAYYHKTKSIAERMIADALMFVKDLELIPIKGSEQNLSIQNAVENALKPEPDMSGFLSMTDDIVNNILGARIAEERSQTEEQDDQSPAARLALSQDLLRSLQKRELYKFIGVVPVKKDSDILKKTTKELAEDIAPQGDADYVHVEIVEFSWSSEGKGNPVNDVCFYSKHDPWEPLFFDEERVSPLVVPKAFNETEIRVYDKVSQPGSSSNPLITSFLEWVDKNSQELGLLVLDDEFESYGQQFSSYISPLKRDPSDNN